MLDLFHIWPTPWEEKNQKWYYVFSESADRDLWGPRESLSYS